MQNLWLIFKCLSLIAGCLLMVAIGVVGVVEGIRNMFKKKTYQEKIDDFIKQIFEESLKNSNDNNEEDEK